MSDAEAPVHLYRIDFKSGEVAHVLDQRDQVTLCAEFFTTLSALGGPKKHPDPFDGPEALRTAAREAGWLLFQTGWFEAKKIQAVCVELDPPEELAEALRLRLEGDDDDDDEILDA